MAPPLKVQGEEDTKDACSTIIYSYVENVFMVRAYTTDRHINDVYSSPDETKNILLVCFINS